MTQKRKTIGEPPEDARSLIFQAKIENERRLRDESVAASLSRLIGDGAVDKLRVLCSIMAMPESFYRR